MEIGNSIKFLTAEVVLDKFYTPIRVAAGDSVSWTVWESARLSLRVLVNISVSDSIYTSINTSIKNGNR